MHSLVKSLGKEARISKLKSYSKESNVLPNGETAYISFSIAYSGGKKVYRGTLYITNRYVLIYSTTSTGISGRPVPIRLQLIQKVEEYRARFLSTGLKGVGTGLFIEMQNGSSIVLSLRSEKQRDDLKMWIETMKLQDSETLLDSDKNPIQVESIPHETTPAYQQQQSATVNEFPQQAMTSRAFSNVSSSNDVLMNTPMTITNLSSETGTIYGGNNRPSLDSNDKVLHVNSIALNSVPVKVQQQPQSIRKVEGIHEQKGVGEVVADEVGVEKSNVVVNAEGVSVATLVLALFVMVLTIIVYAVVSSQRAYGAELHAQIAVQLRTQKSGSSSMRTDERMRRGGSSAGFASEEYERMSSMSASGTRRQRKKRRFGDDDIALTESLNAMIHQRNIPVRNKKREKMSTADMMSEMRDRFQGSAQHDDSQFEIVFKMDFMRDFDAETQKENENVDSKSSSDDKESEEMNDRDSELKESLLKNNKNSEGIEKWMLTGMPKLNREEMDSIVRKILLSLAEQYTRDRLGDEIMAALEYKRWAVYDPRVIALLESKPGDSIRQHLFTILMSSLDENENVMDENEDEEETTQQITPPSSRSNKI